MDHDVKAARLYPTEHAPLLAALMIGSLLLWPPPAAGQVPQLLNYQGYLTNDAGKPVNGVQSITFGVYDAATRGTVLWTETQNVMVMNGLFNVLLGTVNLIPFEAFASGEQYLGVRVGSGGELSPRQRLVSVGYAFRARDADRLGGRAVADFVRSVDGVAPQNGNVDLVAGSNITISPNPQAHSVTISGSALTLPFTSTISSDQTALTVRNTGTGYGLLASSSSSYGVRAQSNAADGYAVYGVANGANARAIVGSTTGASAYGVWGSSSAHYGVYGSSTTGTGVYGKQTGSGNYGYLGSATLGAYGEHQASGNHGSLGHPSYGAYGEHGSGASGWLGGSNAGVAGSSRDGFGVLGVSTDSDGVRGHSTNGYGVHGITDETARDSAGVFGVNSGGGAGVWGTADSGHGVHGESDHGAAVYAEGDLVVTGAYKGNIRSDSATDGAPFPRPAFDSGWLSIAEHEARTLDHGIGGDADDYVVDLQFRDSTFGRSNLGMGVRVCEEICRRPEKCDIDGVSR